MKDNVQRESIFYSEKEKVTNDEISSKSLFPYTKENYNINDDDSEVSNDNSSVNDKKVDPISGYLGRPPAKIPISRSKRYCVYWVLIVTSILLNTDHGTIPAAIEEIKSSLKIEETEVGIFGSLVYAGTATGALFLSFFINKLNRRIMIGISFFFSGILLFSFTLVSNLEFLFTNRFLVGFSQSLISIYIPVWIDQYTPTNYKTIFIAMFQLSSLTGLIIGYITTTLVKKKYDVSVCNS
jgi:hypothetical protein